MRPQHFAVHRLPQVEIISDEFLRIYAAELKRLWRVKPVRLTRRCQLNSVETHRGNIYEAISRRKFIEEHKNYAQSDLYRAIIFLSAVLPNVTSKRYRISYEVSILHHYYIAVTVLKFHYIGRKMKFIWFCKAGTVFHTNIRVLKVPYGIPCFAYVAVNLRYRIAIFNIDIILSSRVRAVVLKTTK